MPRPISHALGISHEQLEGTGAFDGFVDVDARLYIDPHLLDTSTPPELSGARARFDSHFENVLRLLRASKSRGDAMWQEARRRLFFTEIPSTSLGYAKSDTRGSGIGAGLAQELCILASEIIAAGIEDPAIFELVGLLQEGIGADRISDMTASVILPDLLQFTERLAQELRLDTVTVSLRDETYSLPSVPKRGAIILVPKDILRHLPVANSWYDIDIVASHNAALRRRVNPIIGDTWRRATRRVPKWVLRQAVLEHPELLRDLLTQYKAKPTSAYDFDRDPDLQQQWYHASFALAAQQPLDLTSYRPVTPSNVVVVVEHICTRFKKLIEDNRLHRLLYNDDGTTRRERAAQLTFYAIAQAYCEANDLDISPEADAGAGPVDFKFSRGYREKVTVEVKLSSNSRLVHGFRSQLPTYDAAEDSIASFYLIVQVSQRDSAIRIVETEARQRRQNGKPWPRVVSVDGRLRAAASRR